LYLVAGSQGFFVASMIKSFADHATEAVWFEEFAPEFPASIKPAAVRKLQQLDATSDLRLLKAPPGNKLHRLTHDRAGQYAIWINTKYRICFRWDGQHAHDVEITDYH
jgi:proteic killer suppression protein